MREPISQRISSRNFELLVLSAPAWRNTLAGAADGDLAGLCRSLATGHALLAEGVAEQALAERRAVIEAERLLVAAVEDEARQLIAQARQQVAAGQAAQHAVETRLADL